MSNKTRKYIWPVSLAMSLALIGALAAVVAFGSVGPQPAVAHGPCSDLLSDDPRASELEAFADCVDAGGDETHAPHGNGNGNGNGNGMMVAAGDVTVESSSTSGSAVVELKLKVKLTRDVPVGGAFVLYLEDDYAMPESISAGDVYFVSMEPKLVTGNGSRVYATVNPEIETDAHFTADKKDFDIRVSVPDMCANNEMECEGANGLMDGDTVTMVIQKSAGIANPSEAGTHSVGASVLGSTDPVKGPMYRTDKVYAKGIAGGQIEANAVNLGMRPATAHDESADVGLMTVRKIGLSDVDNKRGYEHDRDRHRLQQRYHRQTSTSWHIMGAEPSNAKCNEYLVG